MPAEETGEMATEAAMILPLFFAFMLLLNCFVQISIVQMALQSAVSETVKQLAVHMYPAQLLYREVKQQLGESQSTDWFRQALDRIREAEKTALASGQLLDRYEAYIPQTVAELLEWQQQRAESAGFEAVGEAREALEQAALDALYSRVAAVVDHYGDPAVLRRERLTVTRVQFPDLDNAAAAQIGIDVEYALKLPIPFLNLTVPIRQRAFEWAWISD